MSFRNLIFGIVTSMIICSSAGAEVRVVIGTAGTAGALYPMGVAMAESINRHVDGVSASAEATAASLANLRGLSNGDLTWGISSNEIAYQAYNGQGPYEGRAIGNLRSLFGTVGSWVQVFVPADSPVKTIADFEGLRVGVGAAGSGGEQASQRLLAFHGLNYDTVDERFMEVSEMADALSDGNLDAFIVTHPLRSAPLINLTTSHGVKLIPVVEEEFYEKHPYFARNIIPGGTYDGIAEDVHTPTTRIVMYTTSDSGLDDERVYEMLAAIWDNRNEWSGVHAAMRSVTLERALIGSTAVPLHPSAARYFAEKGLEVPGS